MAPRTGRKFETPQDEDVLVKPPVPEIPQTWNTRVEYTATKEQQVIAETPEEAQKIAMLSVRNAHYTKDVVVLRSCVAAYPLVP
jgi:hypothetical protein